ncbi:hypothetical protein CANINC_002995 [Pichia inconspicua]|uniref:Micro-fibrillar-associated protein 1 C-terminal domain-containing protein n=1 Tax=Pichia inconspicua TaxID=52247 RepID=A0A4T0WZS4_9ASCO|nr:hypothetical protein CANINC_002995 [[Candida] inconspicua]
MSESSGSGSGSGSESESDQGFTRKVVFKRKEKGVAKEVVKVDSSLAETIIARNNSRITNESSVEGEAALVQHLDDSEAPGDLEEWKLRELKRLHRDRNERLEREERS